MRTATRLMLGKGTGVEDEQLSNPGHRQRRRPAHADRRHTRRAGSISLSAALSLITARGAPSGERASRRVGTEQLTPA